MKIINHSEQLTVGAFIKLMVITFLLAGIVLIIATAWLPDPVVAGLMTALMLSLLVPVFLRISRGDPQVRRWSIAGILVVALFFATYTTAELLLTGYASWAVEAASITTMFAFLIVGMYQLRGNHRKEESRGS